MKDRKKVVEIIFFIVVTAMTFYMVFFQQNPQMLFREIANIHKPYLIVCLLLGIGFVCMEGIMIHRILGSLGEESRPWKCIRYSFIGFFYSGITPSATGGQPMQLYYMCKDGHKGSHATVTLMIVGLFYKAVLVVIGVGIAFAYGGHMDWLLGNYQFFFWLGLALNSAVVGMIIMLLVSPGIIECIAIKLIRLWCRRFAPESERDKAAKIHAFVQEYRDASIHMRKNPVVLVQIFFLTFLQRMLLFVIPVCIYRGYGLYGENSISIVVLQAAIYLAVDILPLPGAQGITETIYQSVMKGIFGAELLMPSLIISRFANFYFLLVISLLFSVIRRQKSK